MGITWELLCRRKQILKGIEEIGCVDDPGGFVVLVKLTISVGDVRGLPI